MRRLYIDFDGVVMDTIPPLYAALEKSGTDVSDNAQVRVFMSTFDFNSIVNATIEELDKVEGIGEARATAIKNGLKRIKEQVLLKKEI